MKHLDLGVLDDDVLLFGGPYSNLQDLRTEPPVTGSALRGIHLLSLR